MKISYNLGDRLTDVLRQACSRRHHVRDASFLHRVIQPQMTRESRQAKVSSTNPYACMGISYSYIMVCLLVRGDDQRPLVSRLSPVQAGKPWYYYFISPSSV